MVGWLSDLSAVNLEGLAILNIGLGDINLYMRHDPRERPRPIGNYAERTARS